MDGDEPDVRVTPDRTDGRVAVTVGGDPFTTYLPPDDVAVLEKPVLYPLRAASGTRVTRGYPLDPRAGERVDHPHHVGHWLNYDPVGGVNFWANSGPGAAERWDDLGTIRHRSIERATGGPGRGELVVTAAWEGPDGVVLDEETRFVFRGREERRVVDRITCLEAREHVAFEDSKEGAFAVRAATGLEHPEEHSIEVVDDPDAGTTTAVDGAAGRTGEYLSSARVRGPAVWGTRAEWVRLSGRIDGESLSVTIMDHPANVGHPTYWMARGYGLFAANPFGQAVYSDGEERLGFELDAGASTTLRYRIAIDAGRPGPRELDDRHEAFADTVG